MKLNRLYIGMMLAGAFGCSGADEPRQYSSGVDAGTAPVATLDTAQQEKLCASFDAYVTTYLDFDAIAYVACIPGAIWTTTTPDACRQNLSNCMSLFPKPIKVDAMVHTRSQCFDSLAQCQATVDQLEGCVDVNLDRALSIVDNWTCDLAGNPNGRKVADPSASTVQVCSDINAACNNFANVNSPD